MAHKQIFAGALYGQADKFQTVVGGRRLRRGLVGALIGQFLNLPSQRGAQRSFRTSGNVIRKEDTLLANKHLFP